MIAAAIRRKDSTCNCFSLSTLHNISVESIGQRVARLRASRQVSQYQLATEVGCAQPTIANIERGRTTQIKGCVLQALASALGTTPDYILNGGAQGDTDEPSLQAELVSIWRKLPQAHRETLLQTARGLLRAAEISPPTVPSPAKVERAPRKQPA